MRQEVVFPAVVCRGPHHRLRRIEVVLDDRHGPGDCHNIAIAGQKNACDDAPVEELCHCGRPLHYSDPNIEEKVRGLIAMTGEKVRVTTPGGTWLVPRHYIALHGLKASELPSSTFERVV
jgi:hypothetical protein